MTSEGGDPIQLTYGEFDSVSPRWSPDGRKISYISNEKGNTSLWVMDIPGGKKINLTAKKHKYMQPMGKLKITVTDEKGKIIPARLSVTDSNGKGHGPVNSWLHSDDYFDRQERKFEYTYFHTQGTSELLVPIGNNTIEVTKGLEYSLINEKINVSRFSKNEIKIKLKRITDLTKKGWFSGDLHVHMNYGGTYRNTPRNLAFQAKAEDLHVVENLIVNKEQRIPDISYFRPDPDPVSDKETLIMHSQEYHTSFWGHTGLLGLQNNFLLPAYAGYINTGAASLYPANFNILDLAHEQGAIVGYVHPFDTYPDPSKPEELLTHELPVDVALGKVDYMEIVAFSDHLATAKVWYQLLNCGFKIPAGAGSDTMANFSSLRGPVGMNRVFVDTGKKLNHANFLKGIKAGKTFATNGPLLDFTIGKAHVGDALNLPQGKHELIFRAELKSIVPVDHFEIIGNGKVVSSIPLGKDKKFVKAILKLPVDKSGWYTLRAYSKKSKHPVLDIYPFATTSPIYVYVGAKPIRSINDAKYFINWIDRLEVAAKAHQGWNTSEEKEEILNMLQRSKFEYMKRME